MYMYVYIYVYNHYLATVVNRVHVTQCIPKTMDAE